MDCPESGGFLLTADAARGRPSRPRTKWVILNAPSNPDRRGVQRRGTGRARRGPRAPPACEGAVRRDLRRDRLHRISRLEPTVRSRRICATGVLVVNGVSKSYAMTGWRLGYGRRQRGVDRCESTNCSHRARPARRRSARRPPPRRSPVTSPSSASRSQVYRARRDLTFQLLSNIDGLAPVLPKGAFYLFVGCAGLVGQAHPGRQLLRHRRGRRALPAGPASVATIQGSVYGAPSYFRVSFATSEDVSAHRRNRNRKSRRSAELISPPHGSRHGSRHNQDRPRRRGSIEATWQPSRPPPSTRRRDERAPSTRTSSPSTANMSFCGSAFTVVCHPRDNIMLQVAISYAQPGDVLDRVLRRPTRRPVR